MIGLIIAAVIVVGGGVTIAASDSARPGDVLYPVDRAVEDVRLSVSGEARAQELKVRFSEERAEEVRSVIAEERASMNADAASSARVEVALESAIEFLTEVSADLEANSEAQIAVNQVIADLNAQIDGISNDVRIEVGGNNQVRVRIENETGSGTEVRTNTSGNKDRLEIKTEEGKTKLEVKTGASVNVGAGAGASGSRTLSEAEADVFADKTIVKLEINDEHVTFETSAKTRAEIVNEILVKYSTLTRAEVEAALEVEVEDRASRPEDSEEGSD